MLNLENEALAPLLSARLSKVQHAASRGADFDIITLSLCVNVPLASPHSAAEIASPYDGLTLSCSLYWLSNVVGGHQLFFFEGPRPAKEVVKTTSLAAVSCWAA